MKDLAPIKFVIMVLDLSRLSILTVGIPSCVV